MPSLMSRILPRRRPVTATAYGYAGSGGYDDGLAALPEEDLAAELADTLDRYRTGGRPQPEESEYLELVQDAVDRMAR